MKLNAKIASSVAGASVALTLLGVFSKGIGFIREIIYANNFGLSSEFDLFLSSVALPNVINTAVIYLCQHYFVPSYNKIKKESESTSTDFFNYTFWWFVFSGIIVAIALYLTSGLIFHSYLASISIELQAKGIQIFKIFLFTIPINAGMSVIMAYQQANFKFINPAASLIILNIVVIILILLFSDVLEIFILPLSFIAAYSIAFIFLINLVRDNLKFIPANIFRVKYKLSEINILISLVFIEGLSLSYVLIDRYFIGEVHEGGIAALSYAFVIYSLPISLFSIPLITTMFSKFSNSPHTLQADFKNSLSMNYFIMIPFMFILYFWGDYSLHLFYERGKFSSADTLVTYDALKYYSVSLIFLSTYFLVVKILYSIDRYTFVLIISIVAVFLKILLSILFVSEFDQNGLALSTTLIYTFLCISSLIFMMTKVSFDKKKFFITDLLYFMVSGLFAYIISFIIVNHIDQHLIDSPIISIVLFIFIYLINSFILNNNEFRIIKNTITNIIR